MTQEVEKTLQEQSGNIEDQTELANGGEFDAEHDGVADENVADQDQPEGEQEEQPASQDEKPAKKEMDPEARKFRDQYSQAKGEAEALRKLARKMEEDGFLERDEIATELGMTRGEVDALIDRKPLPEPGEQTFTEQQNKQFIEDFNNPQVQKALSRIYGEKTEQLKLLEAFDWAVNTDPEVREKRNQTPPDELVYLALDEGKKFLADFEESKSLGGEKSLLAEVRKLKAQLAALQNPSAAAQTATVTTVANNDNDEILEDPIVAREKRLKALRGL